MGKKKKNTKDAIIPGKEITQTIGPQPKPLNVIVLFALFISIFASIIGFFVAIYSIIDIKKRNEKGITIAVIAMIISVVKLIAVVILLMNYNTMSVKIYEEFRKHTSTNSSAVSGEGGGKGEVRTIGLRETTQYTGPTTKYNKDDPQFDEACWEAIYTGYCEDQNVDEFGNALCHYYVINEKAKPNEIPLTQIDIRCPLYYIKNTN